MDSAGTTTVAWQATWPGAFPVVVAVQPPAPPGLVMAATGPFGGPFAAPRIAIANPPGATPGAGGSGQVGSANAGKLSLVADAAGRVLVSGLVGVAQLPWPAPGPSAGLVYAIADGAGPFAAAPPVTGLPASGISAPSWTLGPGGQILGADAGVSGATSELRTTLFQSTGRSAAPPRTPTRRLAEPRRRASPAASTPGRRRDRRVHHRPHDLDRDLRQRQLLGGKHPVGDPPGPRHDMVPGEVVSGLISPYFPIAASFDDRGSGIVGYQQTPKDALAVAYLHPVDGDCPPADGSATTAAGPLAFPNTAVIADSHLRAATIQATCMTRSRCRGTLVLRDRASRPLRQAACRLPADTPRESTLA